MSRFRVFSTSVILDEEVSSPSLGTNLLHICTGAPTNNNSMIRNYNIHTYFLIFYFLLLIKLGRCKLMFVPVEIESVVVSILESQCEESLL